MRIYLATPYSDPSPEVCQARFEAANKAAAEIMREGHIVFSPISHSHPIHIQCDLPGDWEFWKRFDESFIDWCDELWILALPGYQESKGISMEIGIAIALNKPIRMREPKP